MEPWISHSNPARQTTLSLACMLVGTILAVGFRHASLSHLTNDTAGFLLGTLLLVIGVWAFLLRGRQRVTVDPHLRCIIVEDTTQFGTNRRTILFSDIARVGIGYLGKKSNFVSFYYLLLHLKGGEEYALFSPGRFYEGSSERSTVEGWQRRLAQYLGHTD